MDAKWLLSGIQLYIFKDLKINFKIKIAKANIPFFWYVYIEKFLHQCKGAFGAINVTNKFGVRPLFSDFNWGFLFLSTLNHSLPYNLIFKRLVASSGLYRSLYRPFKTFPEWYWIVLSHPEFFPNFSRIVPSNEIIHK